jgi:hypothetical protein
MKGQSVVIVNRAELRRELAQRQARADELLQRRREARSNDAGRAKALGAAEGVVIFIEELLENEKLGSEEP